MEILCYGASNTWGYDPRDGSRFGPEDRWPGVLQACLGKEVRVVEEGLSGRTIRSYEPAGSPYNGLEHLEAYLAAHAPFALLILFLGTNDLFADRRVRVDELAGDVAAACRRIAVAFPTTRILLVAPLPLEAGPGNPDESSPHRRKSGEFAARFEEAAVRSGSLYFDASSVGRASPIDGIHLDAENHRRLGAALCRLIRDCGVLEPRREAHGGGAG